jgi:soluble lytic murein transglycosylase-like protein
MMKKQYYIWLATAIGIFVIYYFYKKEEEEIAISKIPVSDDTATAETVKEKWLFYAQKYGKYFDIEPYIILSIICVESAGVPTAKGKTNDYGLGQITPIALQDFNNYFKKGYTIDEMFIGYFNIEVIAGYLCILKKRFGNNYIKNYNSGDTEYSKKVYSFYNLYNSKALIYNR